MYNLCRMAHKANHKNLLQIVAVVGFFAVSISGISDLETPTEIAIALVLLAVFGIACLLPSSIRHPSPLAHLRLGVGVAAVGGLMILRPGWSEFPILLFLLGPHIMLTFPTRVGLTWVGIAALLTLIIFVANRGPAGILPFSVYASGYLFFAIFGWVLVQAENNRRRAEELVTELQQAHQKLQEYVLQVEELTIAQERNRLAREMHDSLGHRLTIASVQLEGAQRLVRTNPDRVEHILDTVREQVRDGLGELRRTVAMLRASVDEDMALP